MSRVRSIRRLLPRFLADERGSYLALMTLALPVLVGAGGLATEGGYWLYSHREVQGAADNAAYSAATAYAIDSAAYLPAQAKAAAASSYGLVDGQNGVTVVLNKPPVGLCGGASYVGVDSAIEVAVTRSVGRSLSAMWGSGNVNICGRAIALVRGGGDCLLALAPSGTGITVAGNNATISLSNCGIFADSVSANAISVSGNAKTTVADSVGAVGGIDSASQSHMTGDISTGAPAIPDPYKTAAASWPQSGGAAQSCSPCATTLSPGTYAGGINLSSNNTTYTMQPGVYYLSGDLNFSGNKIVLNAAGVTIVLLGNAGITGGTNSATITISPPGTGWSAGVAIWAPTSSATMDLALKNNALVTVTGLIYAPSANVSFGKNNGVVSCTQIVANTITFNGNNQTFSGACFGTAGHPKKFGELIALVE